MTDDKKPTNNLVAINCKKPKEEEVNPFKEDIVEQLNYLLKEAKKGKLRQLTTVYEHTELGIIHDFFGESYNKYMYHHIIEKIVPSTYAFMYLTELYPEDEDE